MALKAIIGALTDADEKVRGEYRPGTKEEGLEGKFVLDVAPEGGFALEDVSGLKQALSTERGEVQRLKDSVKSFEGMDANDVRKKLEKLTDLEKIDPAKEADKLAEAKAQAKVDQLVKQHEAAIAEANGRGEKLMAGLKARTLDAAIESALAEADALNPDALRLKLKSHMRLKETGRDDDPFEVEIIDAKGNPMIGDAKGGAMTAKGLIGELRKDQAWATSFKPAGKSGSGAEGSRGGDGKSMSRAAFEALGHAERAQAMADKVTLTD